MKYKSTNTGLLTIDDVKNGDKCVIASDVSSKFVPETQQTYWNCMMKLPSGVVKFAGLMEMSCDKFASKWGEETSAWTGHTVTVDIRTSKKGNQYIVVVPTDDPIVDVSSLAIPKQEQANAPAPAGTVEYPTDKINPEDIPF